MGTSGARYALGMGLRRSVWRAWVLVVGAAASAGAEPPAAPPAPPAAAPAAVAPSVPAARPYAALLPFGVRGVVTPGLAITAGPERLVALERGLAWLAAHQAGDGSWDAADLSWCHGKKGVLGPDGAGKAQYVGGVTGIATCAFLALGHQPGDAGRYGATLAAALGWMRAHQDPEGCVGERATTHYVYNHAFCALALVEAAALTGDPALTQAAQKALDFSAWARNPYWAWRYGVRPGDNDTSATGCVCLPLAVAHRVNLDAAAAGLVEPFVLDTEAFEGTRAWLRRMTDVETGRAGYLAAGQGPARPQEYVDKFPPERSESCTAIALALRRMLPGAEAQPDVEVERRAMGLLRGVLPTWDVSSGAIDLYYWYYGSLAAFLVGGEAWTVWDRALTRALLSSQRGDTDVCRYLGSWDAVDPWGADGGRVYSTGFALLCLATPWRHPTLPAGRADLKDALEGAALDGAQRLRVLQAAAVHGTLGLEKAASALLKSPEASLRAAAVAALARTDAGPAAVPAIAALLADPDAGVRAAAARALVTLGARALPAVKGLVAALRDADAAVRAGAAEALGAAGAGTPEALEALAAASSDPDLGVALEALGARVRTMPAPGPLAAPLVAGLQAAVPAQRAAAARHLGALGDAAHVPLLVAQLGDPSVEVRFAAAEALAALHAAPTETATAAAALLGDADPLLQRRALRLLAGVGPAATPSVGALARLVTGGRRSLQIEALRVLGAVGEPALEALAALFYVRSTARGDLLQAAEDALARVAAPPEKAVPVLTRALTGGDPRAVDGAIVGLTAQGPTAIEPLLSLLRDPARTALVRLRILSALERFGEAALPAVTEVAALLDGDPDATVRAGAARVLGAVGRRGTTGLEPLLRHLDDKDPSTRHAAARALGTVGQDEPRAADALLAIVKRGAPTPDPFGLECLRTLGTLGTAFLLHVPEVVAWRADRAPAVQEAAAEAFRRAGVGALDMLRAVLRGTDVPAREGAILVVGDLGARALAALPELATLLEGGHARLAPRAAAALGTLGKPAVKPLVKALKSPDVAVRKAAVAALAALGKDATSALSTLKQLARTDPDVALQMDAEKAAEAIKKAGK